MRFSAAKLYSQSGMTSDLELSVLRTIAYFSHFSYPLTAFEVWKWLLMPAAVCSLAEVSDILDRSEWLGQMVVRSNGFFGLGDVGRQIADRRNRLKDALHKYEKLAKYMKLLARTPFVEGIAICNSLAYHHTTDKSDIDLFIITKPGRTWSARLFSTLPLMFLRQRPGETAQHPLCLSFFASTQALNLEFAKIAEEDPYLAYWSMTMIPVLDRSGSFRNFIAANVWARMALPHAEPVKRASAFRGRALSPFFRVPIKEVLARKLQEDRFPPRIKAMMNHDTRVVVNDHMLKFHDEDRRQAIALALEEKMKTLV